MSCPTNQRQHSMKKRRLKMQEQLFAEKGEKMIVSESKIVVVVVVVVNSGRVRVDAAAVVAEAPRKMRGYWPISSNWPESMIEAAISW